MTDMAEARIRPHHFDGDVSVVTLEFPNGVPGVGSSQGGYALSGWNDVTAPPDGNMVVGPIAAGSLDYLRGFEFEAGDDHILAPEGVYFVRAGLRVDYDSAPPTSGFVYISLTGYWTDAQGDEQQVPMIMLQASSANPPDDPTFDATIVSSPTMSKLGLEVLPRDGHLQLEVTNNADIPLYVRGQLVIAKV